LRRILFAPSFDREVEEIGTFIEERFGEAARLAFIDDLMATCSLIASFPSIGIDKHGYATPLAGFVFRVTWIFFDHDAEEGRFLHIVDGRRAKDGIKF
jgi:plasmid stabilization system protein ParE